ncbi:MAG: hypothetical protein IJJ55_00685, partial [Clostridia bacterium]|nr:hypothetical protein [Clostridia bacterium]
MANDRRNSNGGNDEFDWEAYDKMTSGSSPAPRRRRSASKRRKEQDIQPYVPSSGGNTPTRRNSKKKKKKKKVLTEKQRLFRKRLRLTIFSVLFIGIIIITGMFIG